MQPYRLATIRIACGAKPVLWILLVVAGCCATRAGHAQTFRYESKPRAGTGGMSYSGVDPAPRMMEPAEEIGRPLTRRRYIDPRYQGRAAELTDLAVRRWASRKPESRLRVRSGRADAIAQRPGAQRSGSAQRQFAVPFIEGVPSDPGVIMAPPTGGQPYQQEVYPGGPPTDAPFVDGYTPDGPWIDVPGFDGPDADCGGCSECQQCGYHKAFLPCVCDWWNDMGRSPLWRNFNTFSGAQGFKGPPDFGMNGNFGFNKGVNWATGIWDRRGVGVQLGATLAFSDFNGSTGLVDRSRTQVFATGGLFHRAPYNQGWQGGAVVDYLFDDWYVTMNLVQIRGEVGYLWGFHEIGVWAAAHTNSDTQSTPASIPVSSVTWQVTDQYNLYYRANFSYGAVGRMWVGLSGNGDLILGGDATAPLSERWAIQIAQNYLLPRDSSRVGGAVSETWGLTLAMVWYPWAKTPNNRFDPYRPLFTVADNSSLFVRMK